MAGHAQADQRFLPRNLADSFEDAAGSDGLTGLQSLESQSSLCESMFPETQKDAPDVPRPASATPTTAKVAPPAQDEHPHQESQPCI